MTAADAVTAVRYGFSDYVECIVVNNDTLRLAPFLWNATTTPLLSLHSTGAPSIHQPDPRPRTTATPTTGASATSQAQQPNPAARPPMGFNSWNYYHCNIDEVTLRAIVDAVASNGMKEAGYQYINIDGEGS